MDKVQAKRQEAGLNCQDVGWGTGKAVCAPSLGTVPESGQFSHHIDSRGKDVPNVREYGEETR